MSTERRYQRSMEEVRRGNLSNLLSALHYDGPQSRAVLARRTGLNRSTIAALVAELSKLGLVSERAPEESLGVGRPSPIVEIEDDVAAIAVEPDVDSIEIAIVGLGGRIHARRRHSCVKPPSPEEAIEVIARLFGELGDAITDQYRIVGIGAALPALVDSDRGHVVLAPNLGWKSLDFGAMLESRLGLRSCVANEAHLSAVAERRFGAGREVDQMIYLIGSGGGVGGGAFVDGREVRGHRGFSTEFGHIVVDRGGEACFCGQHGCLERVVRRDRLVQVLGGAALDADELERALRESTDAMVVDELAEQVEWLAAGLGMLIAAFAPDTIVLGGFLASLVEAQDERLTRLVTEHSFHQLASSVRIVQGGLGSRVSMIGAAERVFQTLLHDPASFSPAVFPPSE